MRSNNEASIAVAASPLLPKPRCHKLVEPHESARDDESSADVFDDSFGRHHRFFSFNTSSFLWLDTNRGHKGISVTVGTNGQL